MVEAASPTASNSNNPPGRCVTCMPTCAPPTSCMHAVRAVADVAMRCASHSIMLLLNAGGSRETPGVWGGGVGVGGSVRRGVRLRWGGVGGCGAVGGGCTVISVCVWGCVGSVCVCVRAGVLVRKGM